MKHLAGNTLRAVLSAAALFSTTALTSGPASAQVSSITSSANAQKVQLGLNKSIIVDLPSDAYDVLVANPAVADAVTRTSRRIYLFGKAVGQTNIFVFGPNGSQIANIDLAIERDVSGLEEHLKRFIPESDIKAELINDNVVLSGTVQTPLDSQRAIDLATLYVSGGEATTGQYTQMSAGTASGAGGVAGADISNPDTTRRTSRIVNLLQVVGEDQVMLKVTIAEVSRNVMKQLGVSMTGGGTTNGITWGAFSLPATGVAANAITGSGVSLATSSLTSYLNAMEQAGVMKTLAEPTLTAVSGEQATFRVGGQFNMITGQAVEENEVTGAERIVYERGQIDYGIGLEFQPVVLSPGRISLKLRTSVSEPTTEDSSSLSAGAGQLATTFLSLRKRLAETTVELPSGGSMMIAGLVRDDVRQAYSGLPGLSKIPVFGTLFRSRSFVRNETELVIIVTPYLARPTARQDLAKPDDNFNAESDPAAIFLGRINKLYGTANAQVPQGQYHGVVGYIYK
ncbi:type II and III secretion system protein family protein [Limoniibacter endophyticus]|uniref:Pilus assembly protein CpaC n=1 Tax=Limoniibacter endophyticus TaxID=1565040 RepID=A0A8J3DQM8_9HYPH|nr:type II and III secretion system protein family protein [Limoniibacter endophyticus]GHC67145.1 pilus assembly protein CpaC [Limoniibacter endophyticus]